MFWIENRQSLICAMSKYTRTWFSNLELRTGFHYDKRKATTMIECVSAYENEYTSLNVSIVYPNNGEMYWNCSRNTEKYFKIWIPTLIPLEHVNTNSHTKS